MGNGPCGKITASNGSKRIPDSSSRLFLKIGRGRAAQQNLRERNHKICVEKYNMLLRHSQSFYNRQRNAIPGERIQTVVPQVKNQTVFHVCMYPQSNGQTEVTNRIILQHLKTRLDQAKGNWVDELPGVLWAYRTTPRRSTGESPFNLVYGMEAIIPAEIGEKTLRIQPYESETNDIGRRVNLDLLGEVRDTTSVRVEAYKRHMAKAYKPKKFSNWGLSVEKIRCPRKYWEVGRKVGRSLLGIEAIGNATYKLENLMGKRSPERGMRRI
ncbi:hypothetical protein Sango_1570500 [Sesamum angolense]|uniref:Reverse transcriptase n=1 Tax=Sesamum angolense TaxID=2727404 RepID=A0AAE2BTM3_9LAMI|nr:hypothetical protein Sango_1570500 [Sesamum angolense]